MGDTDPGNELLDDFNKVLSIFLFLASFVSEVYVLFSVSFNLDLAAYFILIS
jgi:hypothetical protein